MAEEEPAPGRESHRGARGEPDGGGKLAMARSLWSGAVSFRSLPRAGGAGVIGRLARGGLRGAIGAMAMTGMRAFTRNAGLVEEPPPDAIIRQRAKGLLLLVSRKRRRPAVELAHWCYGALGGAAFAAFPDGIRKLPWAGPLYGLVVWLGFETILAPALGLKRARQTAIRERLALAGDHLLYGLVLAETRRQTGD